MKCSRHRKEERLDFIHVRISVCSIRIRLCVLVVCPLPWNSVLWLDMLSIADGRRLSAFGCQNGCVGLALVNQTGPGERDLTRDNGASAPSPPRPEWG